MSLKRTAYAGERKLAVILFIDIMDSSELSNILGFEEYDAFVQIFQEVATNIVREELFDNPTYSEAGTSAYEATIRGDELCVILHCDEYDQEAIRLNTKTALSIAFKMKRMWLYYGNRSRLEDGKSIVDIGIGINRGYLMVGKHRRIVGGSTRLMQTAEGYAINLAKRIEGFSRNGSFSRIFVSRSIYAELSADYQIAFSPVHMATFKGISQPLPIYEIKSFGHVEDRAFIPIVDDDQVRFYEKAMVNNPHELWFILDLARYYYDREQYLQAIEKYREALEIDPGFMPARMYLGRAYFRNFDSVAAQPHLERAREMDPESPWANNFLAVCLRRLAYRNKYRTQHANLSYFWTDYYTRAFELHEHAIRIAAEKGINYPWAVNAYTMTLSSAILDGRYPVSELQPRLYRQILLLDAMIEEAEGGSNLPIDLFLHVRGMCNYALGHPVEALGDLRRSVAQLYADPGSRPMKYREKMSERFFHMGRYSEDPLDPFIRAICEAFIGDMVRERQINPALKAAPLTDGVLEQRWSEVERQYWFEEVSDLLNREHWTPEIIQGNCILCLHSGDFRRCQGGFTGCQRLHHSDS